MNYSLACQINNDPVFTGLLSPDALLIGFGGEGTLFSYFGDARSLRQVQSPSVRSKSSLFIADLFICFGIIRTLSWAEVSTND